MICKHLLISYLGILTTTITMSMAKPTPAQLGIWYGRWVALQGQFSSILMSPLSSDVRKKQLVMLIQDINPIDYGCSKSELIQTFCSLEYHGSYSETSDILQQVQQEVVDHE